ncbi:MAG: hypothetical protein EKK61_00920 [Rickettsiales bacterium]|nr:MAG: hypothetical protein EKK61_00920 [Rickettsiales bacterium]
MSQDKFLQLLTGAGQVLKQSGDMIANNSAEFIEKNVIKGKYVTREEYDQLKKMVLKLEQELINFKNKI